MPNAPGQIIDANTTKRLMSRGAPSGVAVNVVNNSSIPIQKSNVNVDFDRSTRQMIVGVVLDDLNTGGPLSQAFGR